MTSSKQTQTENVSKSGTQQTSFDPRSSEEQAILNQYRSLGDTQTGFINRLVRGGASPFELSSADQQSLDDAFASARLRFDKDWKEAGDYMSTTRGLNKSDSPVSNAMLGQYGLAMADLNSQRALAGLNLGLQGTQMKLMGSQALPAGLGATLGPLLSERMAGGMTRTTGNSSGTTTNINTPSLMTSIGQGMSLGTQALALGAGIGSLGMGGGLGSAVGGGFANSGLGGLSQFATKAPTGMGSGARANSWFM